MIWEGARDLDDDRAPGLASDLACLLLALFNAAAWPALCYLVVAP